MMRRALLAAACIGAVGLVALTEAFLVPAVTTPAARAAMGWTCSSQQQQRTLLQQARRPSRLAASYDEASSSEPNAAWVLGAADAEEESDVDQDGVSLKTLLDFDADAAYLEEQVTKLLDQEWIPQECHRDVARIAAGVYLKARSEGVADLTSMLLTVGTELEEADMGDAFVDAWTVANMVSDLLLARMGREVCCAAPEFSPDQQVLMTEGRSSSPAPATEEYGEADATKAVDALTLLEAAGAAAPAPSQRADTRPLLNPQMPPAFFTMDALHDAAEAYLDEFARFDFMRKFLEGGHEGAWDQANIIMALLLGFRFDEWGNVDASGLHERFRHLPYPPDFQGNRELSALLEAILAEDEDEDKQKGLEEFLEVMVGKAYYHQANPSDEDFASRATLVKWIYEHDFVNEFRNLPSVQAVLGVKARIVEKREGEKPPPRYLY